MIWVALFAGLLSGVIGAMGLGGGAVLIIYLSAFAGCNQLKSQGINLMFFVPIAAAAVTVYAIKKQIKWRLTLKIAGFGLLGAAAGLLLTDFLGGDGTARLFGILLIVMGLREAFGKKTVAKHSE